MTKICDLQTIFSIFLILFITAVSTQNQSPVLCGGLHSGVNPCKESSNSQTMLVKGQALPKPLIVDSITSQSKSRSGHGWKRGLKFLQNRQVPSRRNRPHLRNSVVTEMKPPSAEIPMQYVPQVQLQVPTIDSSVKLAPRFHPIGDPCYKKGSRPEASDRLADDIIITPAVPPKIECVTKSSPAMTLGYSTILNPMMRSQVIYDDSSDKVPQLLSGNSRTHFRLQGPRRNNKPKNDLTSSDRTLIVNPINSNIRMRDHTVNLNLQSSNRINRLKPDMMSSGVRIDNTMNGGFNFYPGNSVVGVAPIIRGDQRTSFSSVLRPSIYGSHIKSLSSNSNRGFFTVDSKENNGASFNTQERMYEGQLASSVPLTEMPADPVSVSLMFNNLIKSYQQASENVGGVNPISTTKISEEKLSYGPQKIPINDRVEVKFEEIPEEKLHIVDKKVIALDLDKQSETLRSYEKPLQRISYGQLGFKEKKVDEPIFQERSMVIEAPQNNPEQSLIARKGPDYFLRFPAPETIVEGTLVPTKPVSSGYGSTNSHFTSNVGGNFAQPRFSPVQSYHQNINEQQKLRSYTPMNRNGGQLINNNRMSSPSNNQEVCFCV